MQKKILNHSLIKRMSLTIVILTSVLEFHLRAVPDPITLVKGVESVREQIPPSRLRLRVYTQTKQVTNDNYFWVLFNGERRYFNRTSGLPTRIMFNGSEVIMAQPSIDNKIYYVNLRNLDMDTADCLFDPRVLGIAVFFSWKYTIQSCLGLNYNSKIELIGKEQVDDKNVWHIRTIRERDGYIKDFWIDDNNFKVYKCVNYVSNNTNQIDSIAKSYYENEEYPWLPSRVDMELNSRIKYIVEILKAEPNVKIPENQWTLSGMEIPKNSPVLDERTRKLIGFWDGKRLIPDADESKPIPNVSFGRPIILLILILLSVVPLTVVIIRNFRRKHK
jgi:hypothetical protein